MKDSSKQTYKELAIPYFKDVFDLIDGVMLTNGVKYYLIGVSAIALELLKKGVKPSRATKDIDFAVMVSSMKQYEDLAISLVNKGFRKVDAPWTFYHENYNVVLDLLPFGDIEEHNTIQFNNQHSDLHVLGFKEVLEEPEKVQIDEKIASIPTLPGMIILKLVSWSDRPEERENDLSDILRIIEHYFEHNFDEIVEFHNDTFPEEGFDRLLIAAEVLGRKAKTYLMKSTKLSERVLGVLETNLDNKNKSQIAREWARLKTWEINRGLAILAAFKKGIVD